ncbi:MAG: hypothetical protein KNN13_09880 [Hydrogenobacter thermophilus]|uniref:hypothetical protein n=1 Tax=Hydrogenobacter thermophilus TaxID=940 RepID=UPI001C77E2E2|nr:hypothetical protein [Hydrogenobacter thermophilus]QWK19760.1 MAG: hypothetical protein KNN13_09880 [Hydrogenobacter thermophilus]
MSRFLVLYGMFLLIFFVLSFFSYNAYHLGYAHLNLLFYAEKVLLAREGDPPRLENIGFVYPPLAFLPFWIVKDYLLVSPMVSAFVLTAFLSFLLRRCQAPVYALLILLLLNPLLLFLAVYRFEVLTFYLLLTMSLVMLILHMEKGYTLYLFVGGFLFGLCFFLDFRSLFLTPFLAFAIYLSTKQESSGYRWALMIVKLSLIIFFSLAWLYLNWIFTESPFTFITSPYSFFKSEPIDPSVLSVRGNLLKVLEYTTLKLLNYLPLILPYLLVLFSLRKYRYIYLTPVYLVYLSPVILIMLSVYFSTFFPAYYHTVLFLLFAITFQASFGIKASRFLLLAFILSFLSSWLLPLFSKEENEKNFVKFLITGEIKGNLEEYKKVAQVLKDCNKVLIDDAGGFPIVYLVRDPKKFYLPYMYEYYTVLSYPEIFADCLLVDKANANDKVMMRFPKAGMGFLKGYSLVYEGETYNVFRR